MSEDKEREIQLEIVKRLERITGSNEQFGELVGQLMNDYYGKGNGQPSSNGFHPKEAFAGENKVDESELKTGFVDANIATLEDITGKLKEKYSNMKDFEMLNHIQQAGMLAFIRAASQVVNQHTMPVPVYRLIYDARAHSVDFTELEGNAGVPTDDALDISISDLMYASIFRDKMPLLLEGITGVGKTYTSEQIAKTVLPKENYKILRLNQNMSNVLQPYTEGYIENGLLRVKLRRDELEKIAILFIDEVNRGDTNQVLQLLDGTITLSSGERGTLGLPVPTFRYENEIHDDEELEELIKNDKVLPEEKERRWMLDYSKKRAVVPISAQNPPATKDAKYSGTRRTDAAQSNRNLQIDVPNAASSMGASTLVLSQGNGQHERFLKKFKKHFYENMGISNGVDEEVFKENYIDLFAFITDPEKTEAPCIHSALEFIDSMFVMISPDIEKQYNHEKNTITAWTEQFKANGNYDFTFSEECDVESEPLKRLNEVVSSFEESPITRDIIKIKKIADAISLTRRIKKCYKEAGIADKDTEKVMTEMQAYSNQPSYITVQDVASAFAIMLNDKKEKEEVETTGLIDQVLKEYIGITEKFAKEIGYPQWEFDAENANLSVYNLAFQHALDGAVTVGKKKPGTSVDAFVQDIAGSVSELKRMVDGIQYRIPMIGRMIADLTTLAGYTLENKDQVTEFFEDGNDENDRVAYKSFFKKMRSDKPLDDIYLQRLTRVLGV